MKNQLNNFINNKLSLKKKTKFTLIIGSSPSKGARSPLLWNNAYRSFGQKTRMYPADVSENNLKRLIEFLKLEKNFQGSSVTIPFKEKVLPFLDDIDQNAKAIGSVNTIIKKKNRLRGLNTDYYGSMHTLKKIKIGKESKNVLILGCGGAGKACIVSAINYFKKSKVMIYNRNAKKLKKFLTKLSIKNTNHIKSISSINQLKKINQLDLIINTTSIGFENWFAQNGYYNLQSYSPLYKVNVKKTKFKILKNFMKKNNKNIGANIFNTINFLSKLKKLTIFDIIYQPGNTTLMKIGSLFGHNVYNGLEMNFIQAVKAFSVVNNNKDIKKIMKGMQNGK